MLLWSIGSIVLGGPEFFNLCLFPALFMLSIATMWSGKSLGKLKQDFQYGGFNIPLYVNVQHEEDYLLSMNMRQEIIKQKIISCNDLDTLQETVIEWEEEIKEYKYIFEQRDNFLDLQLEEANDFNIVRETFDASITKSKPIDNEQHKYKKLLLKEKASFEMLLKVSKYNLLVGSLFTIISFIV